MFRPFVTWIDEPPVASFHESDRLAAAGYPQTGGWLGYAPPDEDGLRWVRPFADGMLVAPTYGELCRFYLDTKPEIGPITVFCQASGYTALSKGHSARAATPEDALARLILAHLTGDPQGALD